METAITVTVPPPPAQHVYHALVRAALGTHDAGARADGGGEPPPPPTLSPPPPPLPWPLRVAAAEAVRSALHPRAATSHVASAARENAAALSEAEAYLNQFELQQSSDTGGPRATAGLLCPSEGDFEQTTAFEAWRRHAVAAATAEAATLRSSPAVTGTWRVTVLSADGLPRANRAEGQGGGGGAAAAVGGSTTTNVGTRLLAAALGHGSLSSSPLSSAMKKKSSNKAAAASPPSSSALLRIRAFRAGGGSSGGGGGGGGGNDGDNEGDDDEEDGGVTDPHAAPYCVAWVANHGGGGKGGGAQPRRTPAACGTRAPWWQARLQPVVTTTASAESTEEPWSGTILRLQVRDSGPGAAVERSREWFERAAAWAAEASAGEEAAPPPGPLRSSGDALVGQVALPLDRLVAAMTAAAAPKQNSKGSSSSSSGAGGRAPRRAPAAAPAAAADPGGLGEREIALTLPLYGPLPPPSLAPRGTPIRSLATALAGSPGPGGGRAASLLAFGSGATAPSSPSATRAASLASPRVHSSPPAPQSTPAPATAPSVCPDADFTWDAAAAAQGCPSSAPSPALLPLFDPLSGHAIPGTHAGRHVVGRLRIAVSYVEERRVEEHAQKQEATEKPLHGRGLLRRHRRPTGVSLASSHGGRRRSQHAREGSDSADEDDGAAWSVPHNPYSSTCSGGSSGRGKGHLAVSRRAAPRLSALPPCDGNCNGDAAGVEAARALARAVWRLWGSLGGGGATAPSAELLALFPPGASAVVALKRAEASAAAAAAAAASAAASSPARPPSAKDPSSPLTLRRNSLSLSLKRVSIGVSSPLSIVVPSADEEAPPPTPPPPPPPPAQRQLPPLPPLAQETLIAELADLRLANPKDSSVAALQELHARRLGLADLEELAAVAATATATTTASLAPTALPPPGLLRLLRAAAFHLVGARPAAVRLGVLTALLEHSVPMQVPAAPSPSASAPPAPPPPPAVVAAVLAVAAPLLGVARRDALTKAEQGELLKLRHHMRAGIIDPFFSGPGRYFLPQSALAGTVPRALQLLRLMEGCRSDAELSAVVAPMLLVGARLLVTAKPSEVMAVKQQHLQQQPWRRGGGAGARRASRAFSPLPSPRRQQQQQQNRSHLQHPKQRSEWDAQWDHLQLVGHGNHRRISQDVCAAWTAKGLRSSSSGGGDEGGEGNGNPNKPTAIKDGYSEDDEDDDAEDARAGARSDSSGDNSSSSDAAPAKRTGSLGLSLPWQRTPQQPLAVPLDPTAAQKQQKRARRKHKQQQQLGRLAPPSPRARRFSHQHQHAPSSPRHALPPPPPPLSRAALVLASISRVLPDAVTGLPPPPASYGGNISRLSWAYVCDAFGGGHSSNGDGEDGGGALARDAALAPLLPAPLDAEWPLRAASCQSAALAALVLRLGQLGGGAAGVSYDDEARAVEDASARLARALAARFGGGTPASVAVASAADLPPSPDADAAASVLPPLPPLYLVDAGEALAPLAAAWIERQAATLLRWADATAASETAPSDPARRWQPLHAPQTRASKGSSSGGGSSTGPTLAFGARPHRPQLPPLVLPDAFGSGGGGGGGGGGGNHPHRRQPAALYSFSVVDLFAQLQAATDSALSSVISRPGLSPSRRAAHCRALRAVVGAAVDRYVAHLEQAAMAALAAGAGGGVGGLGGSGSGGGAAPTPSAAVAVSGKLVPAAAVAPLASAGAASGSTSAARRLLSGLSFASSSSAPSSPLSGRRPAGSGQQAMVLTRLGSGAAQDDAAAPAAAVFSGRELCVILNNLEEVLRQHAELDAGISFAADEAPTTPEQPPCSAAAALAAVFARVEAALAGRAEAALSAAISEDAHYCDNANALLAEVDAARGLCSPRVARRVGTASWAATCGAAERLSLGRASSSKSGAMLCERQVVALEELLGLLEREFDARARATDQEQEEQEAADEAAAALPSSPRRRFARPPPPPSPTDLATTASRARALLALAHAPTAVLVQRYLDLEAAVARQEEQQEEEEEEERALSAPRPQPCPVTALDAVRLLRQRRIGGGNDVEASTFLDVQLRKAARGRLPQLLFGLPPGERVRVFARCRLLASAAAAAAVATGDNGLAAATAAPPTGVLCLTDGGNLLYTDLVREHHCVTADDDTFAAALLRLAGGGGGDGAARSTGASPSGASTPRSDSGFLLQTADSMTSPGAAGRAGFSRFAPASWSAGATSSGAASPRAPAAAPMSAAPPEDVTLPPIPLANLLRADPALAAPPGADPALALTTLSRRRLVFGGFDGPDARDALLSEVRLAAMGTGTALDRALRGLGPTTAPHELALPPGEAVVRSLPCWRVAGAGVGVGAGAASSSSSSSSLPLRAGNLHICSTMLVFDTDDFCAEAAGGAAVAPSSSSLSSSASGGRPCAAVARGSRVLVRYRDLAHVRQEERRWGPSITGAGAAKAAQPCVWVVVTYHVPQAAGAASTATHRLELAFSDNASAGEIAIEVAQLAAES